MKKIFAAILLCVVSVSYAQAQGAGGAGVHQATSGKLWLVNGGDAVVENVAGLELLSPAGKLVPGPNGNNGPFQFALSNTKNNITFGNLTGNIALGAKSQTELPMSYDGDASGGDLKAAVGIGPTPVSVPVTSDVPEPATGLLAAFGVLGALGFRRRR